MAPAVLRRLDGRRGAEHPRGASRRSARRARRRCTATSRRPSSPTPIATSTSATRRSSTCRCAACCPTATRAERAALIGADGAARAAARRAIPPTYGRGTAATARERRGARPLDDAPDGRRPLGQRRLLHVHDRADRRQRHRRARPRLPAQQRADRLQLHGRRRRRRAGELRRRPASARARAWRRRSSSTAGGRRSRSARRAARRSSPPCCRCSSTTSTSGCRCREAVAAPRASQRNSATTPADAGVPHALRARADGHLRAHAGGGRADGRTRRCRASSARSRPIRLRAPRPPAGGGGADPPRRRLGDGGAPGRLRAVRGRAYRSAMLDVDARLTELEELGTYRRMRMVSGPQGPRVVLDGRPVLLLCSDNHLGLADHPRVREASADAAMRWGAGAGAPRPGAGTMTLHRRLEERLADFLGTEAALLFGSGYLTNLGVIPALAERGEIVFTDALNHPSVADACRLAGAEAFVYDHGDAEHLAWGLRNADGRAALIVTEGVFGARRRRRAARGDRRARPPLRRARDGRRGARPRRRRAGRPRRGRRRRAEPPGRRDRRQPRHRRSAPRAATRPATARSPATSRRTRARSRARRRCRRRPPPRRWPRSSCCASSRGASRSCRTTRRCCGPSSRARASTSRAPTRTSSRSWSATPASRSGSPSSRSSRASTSARCGRPTSPRAARGCASPRWPRTRSQSCATPPGCSAGRRCARASGPAPACPWWSRRSPRAPPRGVRRRRAAAGGVGGRASVG